MDFGGGEVRVVDDDGDLDVLFRELGYGPLTMC